MIIIPYRVRRPKRDPEPEPRHDFSSVQVQIVGRPSQIMGKIARSIRDSDLNKEEGHSYGGATASDGREYDHHVTVKWGLHFQSPTARLRAALASFGPIEATLGKTSLFTNPDADVLKVDVDSQDLHRLNKLISSLVPTHDTHPTYIPHATIAYLKPGRGKKYSGGAELVGQKMTFSSVVFSGKKGKKETLPLVTAAPVYRVR